MRRERLRANHPEATLRDIYRVPHDHSRWRDHNVRVEVTIAIALGIEEVGSVADLSAGDAAVAMALGKATTILGDFAPGYPYVGPIERTIEEIPVVDLFVCSETIEHLDDPDSVLRQIRAKTRFAVVSTPVEAWNDHPNVEHLWAWDREAVEAMFAAADFDVMVFNALDMRPAWSPYCFGIWALR